jgi:hypothetical protein
MAGKALALPRRCHWVRYSLVHLLERTIDLRHVTGSPRADDAAMNMAQKRKWINAYDALHHTRPA